MDPLNATPSGFSLFHRHDRVSAVIAGLFLAVFLALAWVSVGSAAGLAGRFVGTLDSPLGAVLVVLAALTGHLGVGCLIALAFSLVSTVGAIEIEDRLGLRPTPVFALLIDYALFALLAFVLVRTALFAVRKLLRR